MTIIVTHSKVSTVPDGDDTSVVRPSDWNDDHVLVGLGTAAELDAGVPNGVATLDSLGKVPTSELPAAILGALNYQGTWNAATNTPTLTSSVGTKGYYYVVSVAGNTDLNGITDWQIGDWAVYNGTAWQKIDNTDVVTSVNGQVGAVVLDAADVGAVPYTGATGAVDLNAKSLTNVSNLGIGTTSVPTILMRAVGDNNSTSRIAVRGYSSNANSSAMRVTKFRGTVAAPQAPQSGDSLGKFELAGYGTTSSDGYPQASFEGLATENWGATARGAKTVIKVTPNTTTTQAVAVTINQDKSAVFESTVTATSFSGSGASLTNVVNSAAAGTGISVSGATGAVTITNTAPDQTVSLTAGTGISTSGTYPNFTITNTAPSSGGTVTSVAALTLGTTGTDLSSTVANGTTTPVITLQVPTASATNRGALSAADWSTFNSKANAFTYTTGYIPFGQGTTTPNQSAGLQFDGTNFSTTGTASATKLIPTGGAVTGNGLYLPATNSIGLTTNGAVRTYWDATNHTLVGGVTTSRASLDYALQVETANSLAGISTYRNQNAAGAAPAMWLGRSRGTTNGSFTAVQSGDTLGSLVYSGADGTTDILSASIQALVSNTVSTNIVPGLLKFTTMNDAGTTAERMRINSSGGVSIGNTTDPGATNLSVTGSGSFGSNLLVGTTSVTSLQANKNIRLNGTGDSAVELQVANTTYGLLYSNTTGLVTYGVGSIGLRFFTGANLGAATEAMRVFASGGVSIGNTTDRGSASLNVSGLIYPQQAATASAPAYVKGAIYFDTTLNKLRVGGATAWETITSV
jgi:hypothetical protein